MMFSCCRWSIALSLMLPAVVFSADSSEGRIDFFERKIRPVLAKHCYRCHSADAKTLRGCLRLDTPAAIRAGGQSGALIDPADTENSRLLKALTYQGPNMPPAGRLPESVIADFRTWLQNGAALPADRPVGAVADADSEADPKSHYAFQPFESAAMPNVQDAALTDSSIDRFVVARLNDRRMSSVGIASREVLLRRLSFDLIGLPPTLEERQQFLDDDSSDAYGRLVDRLLSSPHFGERWGRHWLDLARYSESNGSDRNVIYPHAWRYARYVIDALNADRPYDVFIREQIAGDLLPADSHEQKDRQLVATGFLTFGAKTMMDDKPERFRMDRVDEQIDVISRSVLALTISCARCHDHKFDPVSTQDYYALAGIFRSTYLLYGPAAPAGNQYGHDRPLQPIGPDGEKLHGPAQKWQDDVAEQVKVRNKARSDRYRVVRNKAALENKLKMATPKAKAGDAAAAKKVEELTAEIEKQAAEIAEWDEKIKKLDETLKQTEDNPPPFPDYAMAARDDETIEDCRVRIAGEYNQLDKEVPRGIPTALTDAGVVIPDGQSGRLQLTEWLTNERNPLTARVAVNRIWQHLFGEGLVRSVDNFGLTGEKPTHPEMLDWLAVQFVRDGWSVKRMIRRIVLSRTYRLSSAMESNPAAQSDPENRLLWRQNQRRLEVEPLRDAMLLAGGELDQNPRAASPVAGMKDRELNNRVVLTPEQLSGSMRTVYLPIARQTLPQMLKTFDFADPSLVIGRRARRTTPAQQLFLLNDPFVLNRALAIARRILTHDSSDAATRVDLLYRILFARNASIEERQRSMQYLTELQQTYDAPTDSSAVETPADQSDSSLDRPGSSEEAAWTDLCHALLASGEFRYVE